MHDDDGEDALTETIVQYNRTLASVGASKIKQQNKRQKIFGGDCLFVCVRAYEQTSIRLFVGVTTSKLMDGWMD